MALHCIYFFHSLSSNLYFLFQDIFPLGGHCFCLVSYTCLVYPFYFLNILELVELDLPVYFLCPLILIFSSSQGQTLSDLNIVKNNINIIYSLQFVICINVTIVFCDIIDVYNSVFNTRFIIYGSIFLF